LNSASNNTLISNVIVTNGTGATEGIFLQNLANNNTLLDNNVTVNGTANSNVGMILEEVSGTYAARNIINAEGTAGGEGVAFDTSDNNTFENNTLNIRGTGNNNQGFTFSAQHQIIIPFGETGSRPGGRTVIEECNSPAHPRIIS